MKQDLGRCVQVVTTRYYVGAVARTYVTKKETPMHASLRERFPARTTVVHQFPDVTWWPFGLYAEIVSQTTTPTYRAAQKAAQKTAAAARKGVV